MKVTNPVIFSKAGFVQKPSQYKKYKRKCGVREMKKQSNKSPKHQNQANKQTNKKDRRARNKVPAKSYQKYNQQGKETDTYF